MSQAVFSAERQVYTDLSTGAVIVQWTSAPCTNQHLYFTSYCVTADDRWLTIISDRDGHPNLYAINRSDGTIRRLSENRSGLLRSYVYPQGGLSGLSKASPSLDPVRNQLYYIRDDTFYGVALDEPTAREEKICDLPVGWYGGYTHISPDGRTLCVPCSDPRAFGQEPTQWEQLRQVPVRMSKNGWGTRIYLIDVATGKAAIAAETPFWVSHVQFDPAGTGRIIFNREGFREGTGQPLHDRIWCLETDGTFRPLGDEPENEWRAHENWAPDGQSVVYHGGRDGKAFVATRSWEGKLLHETSIDGINFWHATGALDGRRLFVDRPEGMISVLDPGAKSNRLIDLCRHDTTIESQDAHAHPITTPRGASLIFTSNRTGHCHVYECPIS